MSKIYKLDEFVDKIIKQMRKNEIKIVSFIVVLKK